MLKGKARIACSGIAVGRIFELSSDDFNPLEVKPTGVEAEKELLEAGLAKAAADISEIIDNLTDNDEAEEILSLQLMMLDDPDITDAVRALVQTGRMSAAAAAVAVGQKQAQEFSALDDPYMRARSADILDVTRRLAFAIAGRDYGANLTERSIIVADDLTPSQTAGFKREYIGAIVLRQGTMNSHASILARNMGVPSLIEARLPEGINGKILGVDAIKGQYYLDPDADTIKVLEQANLEWYKEQLKLKQLRGRKSIAPCGHQILVCANIGTPDEIEMAMDNDCEGVGLMRSEFLYIGKETFPTEEEQYQAYVRTAATLDGRPLVIRTLDIGADKKCPYFNLPKEENPALGLRALRICLTRPEIFKVQLRAILRASVRGRIQMMLPMVTSVKEVQRAKEILAECEQELTLEGVAFKRPEVGIMIETPAAAILSGELAREVDFFSIGTNDLMQYTCALDRQNTAISEFYDPHHPALLELIRITVKNAHEHGIWAGICGELGSDLELTDTFVEYGVDELSVSPSMILPVRQKILNSPAVCQSERQSICR